MYTWCTLRVRDGRVDTVDSWATLGEVIWEMACSSWEEPGNEWLSYVVDAAGVLVATAIFDAELNLLVTTGDGRRFRFPVPEFYREAAEPGADMARCGSST